jgi:hypothetical protein
MPDSSTIVGVLVYDGCVHINDGDGVGTTTSYVIGNSSGAGIDRGEACPAVAMAFCGAFGASVAAAQALAPAPVD